MHSRRGLENEPERRGQWTDKTVKECEGSQRTDESPPLIGACGRLHEKKLSGVRL